ncbi:MAG: hypothetical protein ABIG28_02755 [archaeon]
MERSTYIWIFVISFAVVLSGSMIYFILFSEKKGPIASPENVENLEECGVVKYSGEDAINVVFFSSKEDAEEYVDYFLDVVPFNEEEYKDKFNFFFIDSYEPGCEIYRGIALLCDQKEVTKKAASCPHDYLVVLQEKPSSIRSSAYMNVMSLNSIHPKTVLMHEWGHVFADFAEEYVDNQAKIPRGSKNCQGNCDDFDGAKDGCFEGCTKNSYFRSVENGVMKTLTPDSGVMYGLFNENTIRKRIEEELSSLLSRVTGSISLVTGSAVADFEDCENQKYYLAEFEYEDCFNLVSEEIVAGCPGGVGSGGFKYSLIGEYGKSILDKGFDPTKFYAEGPGEKDENGYATIESGGVERPKTFVIQAPIAEGIDKLNLLDETGCDVEINLRNMGARACKT